LVTSIDKNDIIHYSDLDGYYKPIGYYTMP